MTPVQWIVSVDIGQSIDPTAVAVLSVRQPLDIEQVVTLHDQELALARRSPQRIDVRHLERLPLRMSYPDQIEHVARLLRRPPLNAASVRLVLDQTGVGRPVVDLFRRAGLGPVGITITAGDGETRTPEGDYRVAKLLLVSRLLAALHEGSLRIAKGLAETRTLAFELQDFRATVMQSGYTRFGAREGRHDDLVLAVALGTWLAGREASSIGFFNVPI
jgi:hypothetical protein